MLGVFSAVALAVLAGTKTTVELCATESKDPALKASIDAAIVEHNKKEGVGKTWVPNADLPPALAAAHAKKLCGAKVGDSVWAYGPTSIKQVRLSAIGVNASYAGGPSSFHVRVTGTIPSLAEAPFFFSRKSDKRSSSGFASATSLERPEASLSAARKKQLAKWEPSATSVPEVRSRKLYAYGDATLAKVELWGKPPMSDYPVAFTNWILATDKTAETILHGDQDYGEGTSDAILTGTLDADGDGRAEVLLDATYRWAILHQTGGKWSKALIPKLPD